MHEEQAVAVIHGAPKRDPVTGTRDSKGPVTVLIVDDQALLREILRNFLQNSFPDFIFLEAEDGASAIEACSTHRPRLILMDVCLPDANGIELTTRVKTLLPDARVIVMSYKSGEAYVNRALAAGGWAYICKDRLPTDLIPMVADAIGRDPAKGHKRGLQ
jgi:two-component system response regulator DegU